MLKETPLGFEVNVGDYFRRILDRSQGGHNEKFIPYVIVENTINQGTSENFQIEPVLMERIKDREQEKREKCAKWINCLINIKFQRHLVCFTRE
jgi:hypothetical protein